MKYFLIILLFPLLSFGQQIPIPFGTGGNGIVGYRRSITIDHTKCGASSSSNIPVLVSLSDNTLKTVGNGGHVQNANGYDIQFFSDITCTSPLFWDMVSYNGTTGTVIAWVKIPSVSNTVDLVFYTNYGNATISTYQSTVASVYTSSYKGVFHMNDNAATTTVVDATGTKNGVMTANTSTKTTTGEIGNGLSFSGSDHISLTAPYSGLSTNVATFSSWVKITSYSASGVILFSTNPNIYDWIQSATATQIQAQANTITSTTMNNSTWIYLAFVSDGTKIYFYFNGILKGSTTATGGTFANSNYDIGDYTGGESSSWALKGAMNESRFSTAARGVDWLLTEYNNQSSPGNIGAASFYTVGSEF